MRGVLAYWLRALVGAHLGNEIDQLHAVESAVFGSAKTEHSGGPSPIQIRGGRVQFAVLPPGGEPGVRYLMGPGLTSVEDPPSRYLAPGSLWLRVRNAGAVAAGDLFLAALWALRAFGGVGARSRRGFGTLAVDQVLAVASGGRPPPPRSACPSRTATTRVRKRGQRFMPPSTYRSAASQPGVLDAT